MTARLLSADGVLFLDLSVLNVINLSVSAFIAQMDNQRSPALGGASILKDTWCQLYIS